MRNNTVLMIICKLLVPKFSLFISTKAAAASKPTTPGRNPLNTAATAGCFWYLRKKRLISTIRMNEGSTTAPVVMIEPKMPKACE